MSFRANSWAAYPRDFQQVAVHSFFDQSDIQLLLKVLGSKLAEVVVRVHVVQRQYEVDQRLPAAALQSQI